MRFMTWNVNSIRQRIDQVARVAKTYQPDVMLFQETKTVDDHFPEKSIHDLGYPHVFTAGQKAYNGVAIASRIAPLDVAKHIWCEKDDKRHIMMTLGTQAASVDIHCFYVPAGGAIPDRKISEKFDHKLTFLEEMQTWASKDQQRNKILLGDLNVAPLPTDVWNHKRLLRNVGHTPQESAALLDVLKAGDLFDVARHFVPPDDPLYSWWGYRYPLAVEKDYGWRLDHIWASNALKDKVTSFHLARQTRRWTRPSDHVPLITDIDLA